MGCNGSKTTKPQEPQLAAATLLQETAEIKATKAEDTSAAEAPKVTETEATQEGEAAANEDCPKEANVAGAVKTEEGAAEAPAVVAKAQEGGGIMSLLAEDAPPAPVTAEGSPANGPVLSADTSSPTSTLEGAAPTEEALVASAVPRMSEEAQDASTQGVEVAAKEPASLQVIADLSASVADTLKDEEQLVPDTIADAQASATPVAGSWGCFCTGYA